MKKHPLRSKKKRPRVPLARKAVHRPKPYPKRIAGMKDEFSDLMIVDYTIPD